MDTPDTRSDIRSAWIDATPAQVPAALADPARIARWWGPDGFTSTTHHARLTPSLASLHGGKDVHRTAAPHGRQ